MYALKIGACITFYLGNIKLNKLWCTEFWLGEPLRDPLKTNHMEGKQY